MCLTIKCLLKEYKAEEVPYSLFFRKVIVNRGNSCELKPKKKFLSYVNEQIYTSFRKFSKRTHLE